VDPYSWPLDVDAIVVIALLGGGFVLASRRYRPSAVRAAAFVLGLALIAAVQLTPLATIANHRLLSIHLLQNVVLAEWAPALCVAGLAPALAAAAARTPLWRRLTHPLVALPLWLTTYYLWHLPWPYDAALRHQSSLLHLEHATYFLTGVLVWWPVVHGRIGSGAKAAYLFAAFVLCSPLGLVLALLPTPLYDFYEHAPRLWGLSPLTDQQVGGVAMVGEQAVVFFVVMTVLLLRFFREEEAADAFRASAVRRR
jgi:cytochrome c oxidase assembly factor CtaG